MSYSRKKPTANKQDFKIRIISVILGLSTVAAGCSTTTDGSQPNLEDIEKDCIEKWNSAPPADSFTEGTYALINPLFEDEYSSCIINFAKPNEECETHWGATEEDWWDELLCENSDLPTGNDSSKRKVSQDGIIT